MRRIAAFGLIVLPLLTLANCTTRYFIEEEDVPRRYDTGRDRDDDRYAREREVDRYESAPPSETRVVVRREVVYTPVVHYWWWDCYDPWWPRWYVYHPWYVWPYCYGPGIYIRYTRK